MIHYYLTATAILLSLSAAIANDSLKISIIDSETPTKVLMAKPGSYLGETFTFEEQHSGDVIVQGGVWEASAGELNL